MSDEQEQQAEEPKADPAAELKAEIEALKRQNQEFQQQNQHLQQSYQRDLGAVTAYVNSMQGQLRQPQEPEVEEPEEHKSLRERILRDVNATQNAHLQSQYRAARAQARELAKVKFGDDWQKFGQEADQLLDQQPVQFVGSVEAYDAAMRAVKANHIDEIIEERTRQFQAAREAAGEEGSEAGGSSVGASVSRPSFEPVRTTVGPSRTASSKKKVPGRYDQLLPEQKQLLQQLGQNPEEWEKWSDPNFDPDPYKFQGRDIIGDPDLPLRVGK